MRCNAAEWTSVNVMPRMVHRKSSAIMYSRILERTFGEEQPFILSFL